MRIAALVQIIAQFFGQLLDSELFRLVKAVYCDFLPVVPPLDCRFEMLQLHGLGFGEMLIALRHIQAVEPGLLRGPGAVKEQNVGGDGGIGCKDAARHPDHGMQVEFRQQLLLDIHLGIIRSEQEAVGQNHRRPAALFQPVHDDGHEEVRRFAAGQVIREMVFHFLFLAAAVRRIRQTVIEKNLLDAVIGLPANLFYGTSIPACIMVFKKNRATSDVLFIDASGKDAEGNLRYRKDKNQNKLDQCHIDAIFKAYTDRVDVERFAYVASFEEIQANDFNLNIPRYVDTFEEEELIDIEEVQGNIERIKKEIAEVEAQMAQYLKELGLCLSSVLSRTKPL